MNTASVGFFLQLDNTVALEVLTYTGEYSELEALDEVQEKKFSIISYELIVCAD